MPLYGVVVQTKSHDLTLCEVFLKVLGCKRTKQTHKQKQITHAPAVNYVPSDHSTLQIINLDEFTKAAGVVVVCCLGVPKGLAGMTGEDRKTG